MRVWIWILLGLLLVLSTVGVLLWNRRQLREGSVGHLRQARPNRLEEFVATGSGAVAPDAKEVLPRLVTDAKLEQMRTRSNVCSRPLDGTPLNVVYVIDSDRTVVYLTEELRDRLGVSPDELHSLAVGNLAPSLTRTVVEGVLAGHSLSVVKTGDTFDAARLLLLPRLLKDGEEVIALVPDRDTLALLPGSTAPVDARKLAGSSDGEPLLDVPLRVSSHGFATVPAD